MPDWRVSSTSLSSYHLCLRVVAVVREGLENKKTSEKFGDFLFLVFSVVSTLVPVTVSCTHITDIIGENIGKSNQAHPSANYLYESVL